MHVRGRVKVGGVWRSRAELSSAYPLELTVAWGRVIAKACFRLCELTALEWARRHGDARQRGHRAAPGSEASAGDEVKDDGYAVWHPGTPWAVSADGAVERMFHLEDCVTDRICATAIDRWTPADIAVDRPTKETPAPTPTPT